MAGMKMVSVVLGLCLLVGAVHGFVVDQAEGDDRAWQFSVDGNSAGDRPVLVNAQGRSLVGDLKDFKTTGFEAYDAGVAGSRDVNVNQFSENTFADLPEQLSTSDRQFSVAGNSAGDRPVLANAQGGSLVGDLKDFKITGFEVYDVGVAGSRDANVNQFSENTFADLPEQLSTSDFDANQFQENTFPDEQDVQFDTQESSSGDEGYVYNARLQSSGTSESETNDVVVSRLNTEAENAAPYDYNRFSSKSEGFSTPASEFNHGPLSTSYVLGVSEEREEDARPDFAYDAREGSGADGASVTNLDVQGGSDDKVVPAKEVGKTSEVEESLPTYVYGARVGSAEGKEEGSADGASFTTTDAQESSDDQSVLAKGHEGPASYWTPASNANGAFRFYDARSDEVKKLDSKVDDDSTGAASFAQYNVRSRDTTTSALTSPIVATQKAPQGTHGCPNSYWAEHVKQWPSQLKITTLVSQAFEGSTLKKNLEIIYGTTTLFQALLDTRDDPYSKLLRHAVAALLNVHAKTAYTLSSEEVAKQFNAALASKATAAAQAQKFENENNAFGDSECK